MPTRDGKFQKSSKTFGGGGKGRGRPPGGGFGKRFEGDKPARGGAGGKSYGRRDDGDFKRGGDRGGSYERRDSKPRFGDDSGARPYKKREFGDRAERGGERGGFKSGGERGGFKSGGDRPYKKREFGDRDSRGASGGDRPFKKREFGDRAERGGDRGGFKSGGDRPFKKREFGDRPERGGDRGGFKSGGDRGGFKRDGEREERKSSRFDQQKTYRRDSFNPRDAKKGPKARSKAYDDARMDVAAFQSSEASAETRNRLKSDRASFGAPSSAFLYGAHPVREALQNPKRLIQRLLVTENGFEAIREAYEAAQAEGLKMPQPQYVDGFDLERLLPRDAVHQGILLDVQPLEEVFLPDVLNAADDNAKVLVLDQVTDPHNVGAILRTAVAFGATAVIVQKLHAPEVTGTLAKSASGAVEHCPIVRETNLSRALEQLKEAGFFCIGLDERGRNTVAEAAPKGKVALVLGAEGEGLRRLVSENCDTLAKLPTAGPIASLNVSNAAAVALYELIRR